MKVYIGLLTAYITIIINGAFATTSSTIQGNTGVSVESVTHSENVHRISTASLSHADTAGVTLPLLTPGKNLIHSTVNKIGGVMHATSTSNIIGIISPTAKTLPPAPTSVGEHHSQGIVKNSAIATIVPSIHGSTAAPVISVAHSDIGGVTATKSSSNILQKPSTAAERLPLITIGKHHTQGTVKTTPFPGPHTMIEHHIKLPARDHTMSTYEHGINHDDLSKPIIKYNGLHNNTMHITCFLEHGPLPIRYELILGDRKVQEVTVHIKEPANFTILMTPGANAQVKCKARSSSGVEVSSNIVTQSLDDDTPKGEDEEDDGDKDSGPKHLIALHYILTSVDPQVQKRNTLLLCVCGPTILFVLIIVILLTHFRNRREHHVEV